MTEHDAIESLVRLGLSQYEAKVFIALQKLGVGGASDVAKVTDVPRSQVYGAAERLETLGLIDIQRSDPIQYRPVDIDGATAQLRDQFERDRSVAFDYLAKIQSVSSDREERENIWTVTGRQTIDNRIVHLLEGAEEQIVFGARYRSLLTQRMEHILTTKAADGVKVVIISQDESIRSRFGNFSGFHVADQSAYQTNEQRSGRVLVVDGETILISVLGGTETDPCSNETAIWSSGTGFAHVLIQLVESFLAYPNDGP